MRVRPMAVAAALLLAGACTSPPAADNLLFISLDTTRADHLSAYGYSAPTSPAVEALAARGTRFANAFTHVPSTLPAHSSMFTGLLPPAHGVRCNGKFQLSSDHVTLAEILHDAGFATGAFIGAFPLAARFGLSQGFDVYDDDFSASALTARRRARRMDAPGSWIGHDYDDFERGADEVTDRALAWLETRSGRWFVFAHYFDAHWPYEPADEWRDRFDSAYDAEIAYADRQVGRLVETALQLPGRTLVVLTADHGEGLGDHGEMLHNRFLYDSTLHVPLVIALEGRVAAGRTIEAPVSHVDLLPTIAELLGVSAPAGLRGTSLAGALEKGVEPPARPVYAETLVWSLERPQNTELRALIADGHKLIVTDVTRGGLAYRGVELYARDRDPGEQTDLARLDAELARRLGVRLEELRADLERDAFAPVPFEMDEGTRARLRSLGYL